MPIKKPFKEAPKPAEASARTSRIYYNPYKEEMKPAMRWPSKTSAIDVYRTDPKTGKLESLAHKYDVGFGNQLDEASARQPIDPGMLHAISDANKITPALGVTPKEMVSLLAQEGRTDFGANDLNVEHFAHNKQAVDLYSKLKAMGYDEMQAGLPALMLEKKRVAEKMNVPWQAAWQGMGTTETGRTYKDYMRELNLNAQNIGANKPALDVFTKEMQEPSKPRTLEDVNMRAWVARQTMVQSERDKLKAKGASDQEAQRAFPDAPIPFPDDPNAALYDLTQKYATGGLVGKLAKMSQKLDDLAEGKKAAKATEIFIGPRSKTWNDESHALALKMEDEGASPRTIWEQTMNWRMPSGQWAQEIGDNTAWFTPDRAKQVALTKYNEASDRILNNRKLYQDALGIRGIYDDLLKKAEPELTQPADSPLSIGDWHVQTSDLRDALKQQAIDQYKGSITTPLDEKSVEAFRSLPVWRIQQKIDFSQPKAHGLKRPTSANISGVTYSDMMHHDRLFDAYPVLAQYPFTLKSGSRMKGTNAQYNTGTREITMSSTADDPKSSALHEIQHAIQQKEGWEGGASPSEFGRVHPKVAKELYYRNLGEGMARATQARKDLNMAQRNAIFPEDSFKLIGVSPRTTMQQFMWQGMDPIRESLIRRYVNQNINDLGFHNSNLDIPITYDRAAESKINAIADQLKKEIEVPDVEIQAPVEKATGGIVIDPELEEVTPVVSAKRLAAVADEKQRYATGGLVGKLAKMAQKMDALAEEEMAKKALNISKEPGGNWIVGGGLSRLEPENYASSLVRTYHGPEVENWADKKLTRYIKNNMGTAEDEVRQLFDQGVQHADVRRPRFGLEHKIEDIREKAGQPRDPVAQTPSGQNWEEAADWALVHKKFSEIPWAVKTNPWLANKSPDTSTYVLSPIDADQLKFGHLIDELHNATRAGSDLPEHLRLDPKKLDKVSMSQAVQLVDKINKWRIENAAAANEALANNGATVLHKDYPDEGFKWVEMRKPELSSEEESMKALEAALKYEGDTMGHCVGGYCPDVASGNSRIFSLRDKKGEPHVTIEVEPHRTSPENYFNHFISPELKAELVGNHVSYFDSNQASTKLLKALSESDEYKRHVQSPSNTTHSILQIKGKANQAPASKYVPYVQDFVRSQPWVGVDDLEHAQLVNMDPYSDEYGDFDLRAAKRELLRKMDASEAPIPSWLQQQYITAQEFERALNKYQVEHDLEFAQGGLVAPTAQMSYDPTRVQSIADQLRQEMYND